MYTIKDFENFIYSVNGILDNAEFADIIEWKPEYSKDNWEYHSFIANGEMKGTSKLWDEKVTNIIEFAHCSKSNLLHLIIVEGKKDLFNHVQNVTLKTFNRVEEFKVTYKMFNAHIMVKNHWFMDLYQLVRGYKKWLEENFNQLNTTPHLPKPVTSFKLELENKECFKDVLDKLQPVFIAENVTVLKFKKIFSGKTISPNDKIEWLSTPASLHYFIDEIDKHQKQGKKWITACNCFHIKDFSNTPKDLGNNKDVGKKDKDQLIKAIKQFNFLPLP